MKYLSVCSGVEAASVAWHPLGWTAVGFAEIDKFASAVLAHRFGSNMPGEPLAKNGVPNHGDFTAIDLSQVGPVDILVGGTPCQSFSFAGKRQSLADARGNLTLAYAVLAHELARSHGLRNALWENVPGVLSTDDNAFGCFLGALVGADDPLCLPKGVERWPDAGMASGPRARLAWRLLDAQYFGLAQRRERVFVVVDFGTGADPASVLFESQGMSGNTAPRRETREGVAPTLSARTKGGGGLGTDFDCDGGLIAGTLGCRSADHPSGLKSESDFIVPAFGAAGPIDVSTTLNAHERWDLESETFIAFQGCGSNLDVGGDVAATLGTNADRASGGAPMIAFTAKDYGGDAIENLSPTLRAGGFTESHANAGVMPAIAYPLDMRQVSRGDKFTNNRKEGSSGGAPGTGVGADGDPSPTVAASHVPAVAYDMRGRDGGAQFEGPHDTANIRAANGGSSRSYVQQGWAVRRLTPVETARLQGFPDGWSRIPWRGKPAEECPDGNQYKTHGNSMAVNAMAWIGRRIEAAIERRWPSSGPAN